MAFDRLKIGDDLRMKALYFNEFGDSTVLTYGDLPDPIIHENELMVEMMYIGLNYADIYRRKGNYHIESRDPLINGYEGVGRIVQKGRSVSKFQLGETILFVDVPFANAELVAVPEENAIRIPSGIPPKLAASIGLQGLTADFLAHDLGNNVNHSKVFVHGISGGVGQILSQLLTADGLEVYGVTSTEEKRQLALNQGAKQVFLRNTKWQDTYTSFFDTVYDGIGHTLAESVDLLKNRGKVVFFGMAGGNPPAIDFIPLLSKSKSILTGDLWDYLTSFQERERRSSRLFDYFSKDQMKISQPTIFSLADGKAAHDYLESGKSIGKILLQP